MDDQPMTTPDPSAVPPVAPVVDTPVADIPTPDPAPAMPTPDPIPEAPVEAPVSEMPTAPAEEAPAV